MTLQVTVIAIVSAIYFIYRYLNRTDTPKIKGLPEVPGVPLFGNLLQLGSNHAKVAQQWAKQYGPVFQVRMGNRVGIPTLDNQASSAPVAGWRRTRRSRTNTTD